MGQGCRFESMQLNRAVPMVDLGRRAPRETMQAEVVVAQGPTESRGNQFTYRGLADPHNPTKSEVTDDSFCIEGNWGGFAVLHGHWVGLKLLRAS
jgi:hypothetical protein